MQEVEVFEREAPIDPGATHLVRVAADDDRWGVRKVSGPRVVTQPARRATGPLYLQNLVPEPESDDATRPAEWGWRGRCNAGFGTSLRPGRPEVEHRSIIGAIKQRFAAPQLVMVANPKGAAGKTITSLLLSNTLGLYRGGGVVAVDLADAKGTLAVRAANTGPDEQPSLWDVLDNAAALVSTDVDRSALDPYLRFQKATFDEILAADTKPGETRVLGWEDCAALWEVLRRHRQFMIGDMSNNDRSEAWLWAARHASLLVVPVVQKRDAAFSAASMLEDLRKRGERETTLAAQAVAVVAEDPRASKAVRADVEEVLAQAGVSTVLRVPFDPALDSGERVVHPQLSDVTRRAWERVAATVANAVAVTAGRE